ncbi:MAG: hypothetical protein KIT68_00785 [Phycisphaeraceae bacterium]|nr:hypothetical protein [Phycisphaeraceae bacterium]
MERPAVLFTGYSEHQIDPKQRLAIPAKYRNQWDPSRDGGAWYCVPWPDGHLRLYTESTFTELARRGETSLTPGQLEAELESTLFGFAERLEMDSAGRIALPKRHLELTGLKSDVVVVGARVRLEVRDRAAWQKQSEDRFKQLPGLIAQIEAYRRGHGGPAA